MMPLDAVLPAFLIAALGYVSGQKLSLDVSTLSRVCLYLLTPALTFNSLARSTVNFSVVWRLSFSTLLIPFLLMPLFLMIFRFLGWKTRLSRAMLLPSVFTNAGNYGLPVCLFAFGQKGMDLAVVFMVTQSILMATLGVFIAASSNMNAKAAFKQVLKMPAVYATIAAITIRFLKVELPAIIARPVELLSQAAVPIFLLVLGLQLIKAGKEQSWRISGVVAFLRLIAAPFIVGLIGKLVGLSGLPLKILILQGAMPPAVNSTILAQEFNAHPQSVSEATMLGTIASVLTLSLWIMVLRSF